MPCYPPWQGSYADMDKARFACGNWKNDFHSN